MVARSIVMIVDALVGIVVCGIVVCDEPVMAAVDHLSRMGVRTGCQRSSVGENQPFEDRQLGCRPNIFFDLKVNALFNDGFSEKFWLFNLSLGKARSNTKLRLSGKFCSTFEKLCTTICATLRHWTPFVTSKLHQLVRCGL